jgi:hypothetical protein
MDQAVSIGTGSTLSTSAGVRPGLSGKPTLALASRLLSSLVAIETTLLSAATHPKAFCS